MSRARNSLFVQKFCASNATKLAGLDSTFALYRPFLSAYSRRCVSDEGSNGLPNITVREFASEQRVFHRYRLVRTLGRGGMGVVWLAHDEELERDVALKFLPELLVHDRAVLADLKRETRRSLELTHKNIVRIYDFVHDKESGCISMEYIDGDTVSNLRADRTKKVFETHELQDWVSQLCDALDYAHTSARIVHRDLKPANLMVNQRGELKVSDFGIARSLSDSVSKLTAPQGKSGTLVYMSPQQLEGEPGTPLDDIYSIGATLYELLTSKPPFYSGNVDRQIRERKPPAMSQRRQELEVEGEPIDRAWEEVVQACMAKEPAQRPQSVSEIARRLEVASPKTRRARAVTAKRSRKHFIAAIGALALLSLGGLASYYYVRPPRSSTAQVSNPAAPASSAPNSAATAAPVVEVPVEPPQTAIDKFVKSLSGDADTQLQFYGRDVRYYNAGRITKPAIRADLQRNIDAWPQRVYSIHDTPKVTQISPTVVETQFPMAYTLANDSARSSGVLDMTIRFRWFGGAWRIIEIQKKPIVAQRNAPLQPNK